MTVFLVIAIAAGILAALMGSAAWWKGRRSWVRVTFGLGMWLLALESFCNAAAFQALLPENILFWQKLRMLATSFLPGVWLFFSLTYSRGNYSQFLRKWIPALVIFMLLPVAGLLGFEKHLFAGVVPSDAPYEYFLKMGPVGSGLSIFYLLGSVLILMNLERTFRASVGTMRWRIKFMILGLAVLFVVRFYTTSQNLLFSGLNQSLLGVNAMALLLAIGLISRSLWRQGQFNQDVYPSQSLLHYSLTGVLAGVYLLVVGFLAKLVSLLGGGQAFPLQAFFVLIALIGLSVLLLSERVRQRTRLFISRHFHRPYYDYRKVWTTFTESTAGATDRSHFCRSVVKWVSDTFNVLTVTIWVKDESRKKLVLGGSSALTDEGGSDLHELEMDARILAGLGGDNVAPVVLETSGEPWARHLKEHNPSFFPDGGDRVCVPIVADGKLLGLLLVGDRVNGAPFSVEDLDLLSCLGDQIAANLLNIQLRQQFLDMKEMEAFQAMSAFFVHDLKNTASTLTLMLKNMPAHFEDPEFRKDALRGLSKSVDHINGLISRLSLLRQELQLHRTAVDPNALVQSSVRELGEIPGITVETDLQARDNISADAGQLRKVLSNLLMNAIEAMNGSGTIRLATSSVDGRVALTVADHGCGIDKKFLETALFRPFQTTKKKGIGIGMFLSKRIVEGHGGQIDVESEPGQGATFRLWLPVHEEESREA